MCASTCPLSARIAVICRCYLIKWQFCQIDCWRIQPNTERPGNFNELISFLDSAPPPPPTPHYCTVLYYGTAQYPSPVAGTTPVRTGLHMDHHIPQHSTAGVCQTIHSYSLQLATSTARMRAPTPEPCSVQCWKLWSPAVHRGIDTFVIRLLNSPVPLRSLFLITLFLAPNNVETTHCSLRSKVKV